MYRKYSPSKAKKREFAETMDSIRDFCDKNDIRYSRSMDSYYFTIGGKEYRVSNHSVESSNGHATDEFGNELREKYHPDGREDGVIYIHAGKTRIKEIFLDLQNGFILDGRGRRI